jgi:hypothetical protein
MVNITYNFNTFNDFKNALYKMREYMRSRGWNDKPQLSDLQWGEWIGAGNDTPYIQLKQNFYENHRDCFQITIRKLTNYGESEVDFDRIALGCNLVRIVDKVETKPYGFIQRTLNSWINKQRLCVCCGSKWDCDFGHNPAPVCDYGRCCDECNQQVIHIRFREAGLGMNLEFHSNNDDPNVSDAEIIAQHKALTQTEGFGALIAALKDSQMERRGIKTKKAKAKKW